MALNNCTRSSILILTGDSDQRWQWQYHQTGPGISCQCGRTATACARCGSARASWSGWPERGWGCRLALSSRGHTRGPVGQNAFVGDGNMHLLIIHWSSIVEFSFDCTLRQHSGFFFCGSGARCLPIFYYYWLIMKEQLNKGRDITAKVNVNSIVK